MPLVQHGLSAVWLNGSNKQLFSSRLLILCALAGDTLSSLSDCLSYYLLTEARAQIKVHLRTNHSPDLYSILGNPPRELPLSLRL